MVIQTAFGKAIRAFRNELGISQEQFALMIGMDRSYYASVECGKRNLSLQNIQKIAKGFEIPISELFKVVDGLLDTTERGEDDV